MSYCFAIKSPKSISYEDFINAIGLADLIVESDHEDVPEHLTGSNLMYIEETSCRGVTISHSDDDYEITINHPSCRDDWHLGLKAIESLAEQFEQPIEVEDRELSVDEFRKIYNASWIAEQFQIGADVALQQASEQKGGGTISIEGSIRPFYMGERLAKEILSNKSKEDAHAELVERMRNAQFVGPEYFVPKVYEMSSGKKFVAFGPNLQMVCPWVQYVALATPDNESIFVPFEALADLHAGKISWLDEKQTLLEPFSKEEWASIIEKAKAKSVDLEPELKEHGLKVIVSRARERYEAILEELEDMDEEEQG